MTDLDDALNTSSVRWTPPYLTVFWKELPSALSSSGNPDALVFMDDQMTGAYEVTHSLDDGLPDPVTLTTSNDASGKAVIPLIGRQGMEAKEIGWRGTRTLSGSVAANGQASIPFPASGVYWGDYVIVALTVNSQAAAITPLETNPDSMQYWTPLATVQDGSTHKTLIYGRSYWQGLNAFAFGTNVGVNVSAVVVAAYARSANWSSWVEFVPQHVATKAETVSSTSHTSPVSKLRRRGYVVSVWAEQGTTGGAMTYTGPGSELVEVTTTAGIMIGATGVIDAGDYTVTATTTSATDILAMATIALEIADRPTMDAREFFSPFNRQSPVVDFDRDTAYMYLTNNVISPNGPVSTTIFSGQMEDIGIKGREAEMKALSLTRLDLDKSLVLPVVRGDRENASVDWLVTWVMARGGMYAGPAPGVWTRAWIPAYGSVHAHFASEYAYSSAVFYNASGGAFSLRPPKVVPGPFMTAMYAQQTATSIEECRINLLRLDLATTEGLPVPWQPEVKWNFAPHFVRTQTAGRVAFWIRGDPAQSAPSYAAVGDDLLMQYNLYCNQYSGGPFLGYVIIQIRSSDRCVTVRMGADHTGSTTVAFTSPGMAIPTNGSWNFVGIKWDYTAGAVEVNVNGTTATSNLYATNGDNDPSLLPLTETGHYDANGTYTNYFRFHLPFSDLVLEAGSGAYSRNWSDHYPVPMGNNAVMRPTYQELAAVAEEAPVQGWDLLVQLAQSSLSMYRTNEGDTYEFLPPSYFGETPQLTSSMIADTEVNTGELDVVQDPSKTRNVVTVNFSETRVASNAAPVLDLSTAVEIPIGTTTLVFALEQIAAEIHGQSVPFGALWQLTNLTAAQVAAPTTIPTNAHYISFNAAQDGSGVLLTTLNCRARIVSVTASTVTISFFNNTAQSVWIANNGDQVPFMRILGYGVSTADGYVTSRDQGSITKRKERPLDVALSWVQTREVAEYISQTLVTQLARPRPEVVVETMGDPRRKPGDLVTLKDGQGTRADGTWRVMAVVHTSDGARYTQKLDLVQVPPIMTWDNEPGWDEAIWGP